MIAIHFLWLLAALVVFFMLRRLRLLTRIAISMLVFLVLSGLTMYFVLRWAGDPPPQGSVPLTKEALEQEGMTQEEWEEYKRSVTEEGTDPEDEK